jgi:hypothetical protein
MAELVAMLLLTLSGLFGSGAADEQYSELLSAAVRRQKPVPMQSVEVLCSESSDSCIGELAFSFGGLVLEPLLIESARIEVGQLSRDAEGRMTMDGIAWTARISDKDLTAALQSHVDRLHDASVKIDKQGLTLYGSYPLLGVAIPYSLRGQLAVENDSELVFRIDQSKLSGLAMPAGLNALIEKEVNPVYDLKTFSKRSRKDIERAKEQLSYEFALHIESISCGKGHIIVAGSA